MNQILTGDALHILQTLPENSVDSIVCDPPAGISFMGLDFDSDKGGRIQWVAWLSEIMSEARRCLKPGGHALVWALPKTSHWTACALEDAGFELRDKLYHIFASGFPKSHNISIAIDRMSGAEREIVSTHKTKDIRRNVAEDIENGWNTRQGKLGTGAPTQYMEYAVTKPSTPEAQQWEGWGTALKPAVEEWILARKPLAESSVARNVLAWGCGGLNIDNGRIGTRTDAPQYRPTSSSGIGNGKVCYGTRDGKEQIYTEGRWPAHLLISHAENCRPGLCVPGCPALELDEQSGVRKSGMMNPGQARNASLGKGCYHGNFPDTATLQGTYGDEGGASRFFTQFFFAPKASKAERNIGCEGLPEQRVARMGHGNDEPDERTQSFISQPQANIHPTVKNQQLMRWLCKLITPPNGIVLDCFAGSGSTGVAAITEGFRFIGIELDPEYAAIATARLNHALAEAEAESKRAKQLTLIDIPPAAPRPRPIARELWAESEVGV